jgi:hypothetical protein
LPSGACAERAERLSGRHDGAGQNDGRHVDERTSILVIDAMEQLIRDQGALN